MLEEVNTSTSSPIHLPKFDLGFMEAPIRSDVVSPWEEINTIDAVCQIACFVKGKEHFKDVRAG